MKIEEHFYLLKRRIFKKNNIIFITILVILLFVMFLSLTVMTLYRTNEIASSNKKTDGKTIYVYPPLKQDKLTTEDLDKIKSIDHVSFVGGKIYFGGVSLSVDELNKPFSEAEIFVQPLLEGINLKMVKGNQEISNGEMICPVNFYSYEAYSFDDEYIEDKEETEEVFNMKKKIIKSAKINGRDLIGKNLKTKHITSYDYNDETGEESNIKYNYQDFKIVGTYDQSYTMDSLYNCYISKDDYLKLVLSDFEHKGYIEYEHLQEQELNKEYNEVMIILDEYKNMNYVHQELDKLKYVYEDEKEVNQGDKLFFTYAPMFISIIIILIAINIIYNFNSKKIKGRVSNYALLKSLGYDNKTIEINEILENVICYLISFVISLSIFITCFVVLKNNYLAGYVVEGMLINIPVLAIGAIFVIVLCLLIIINNKLVAKKLKHSVLELLRKEI